MRFLFFSILGKRIKAIPRLLFDKSVPKRKKLIIIGGILYLLSPIDLIPTVLFPISWVDDLIVWIWIIWYLRDELDKYWIGEKPVDLSKSYKGKTVIHGVDFEIKDEEGKN